MLACSTYDLPVGHSKTLLLASSGLLTFCKLEAMLFKIISSGQVHFFLKRRVGSLTDEEHARLDRLALGLRMLGALPLPWQQRCSALHEHPRLILETLLMGKQLKAASQVSGRFCL